LDERRDDDKRSFCTRSDRFALLVELAASGGAAQQIDAREGDAPPRAANAPRGVGRYFRWASRST
jgi:hypothetical protein